MLCVTLKSFQRSCGATTGGVSRVWIFDREDFNFTQAAAEADGSLPAYTAIARRVGADDGLMYPVKFEKDEAEYKYTMTRKGSSVKYDHQLEMLLSNLDLFITQWNIKVDAAAACCGIGIIIELNSGVMMVLGEKYVNANAIAGDWRITQDGSSGTSGKLRDDVNGHTAVLKGDYSRLAYTYSGTVQSIIDLETVAP